MAYLSANQEALSASNPHVVGLAAGTLITTPDGDKKIEDVKAGDLVLSGVGSGYSQFRKVDKAMSTPYHGLIVRITTDSGQRLRATPHHVCFASYAQEQGGIIDDEVEWINGLAQGSVALVAFDSFSFQESVSSHRVYAEDWGRDWENELDEAEELARSASHACGGAKIERFAGFIRPSPFNECWGFRFKPANEVRHGVEIPILQGREVKEARISNVIQHQYDGLVYALDVPKVRNFSANGILVHDSTLVQF